MADELINTLKKIKTDYENAITIGWHNEKTGEDVEAGTKAVTSLIRSQKLIKHLHEYTKKTMVKKGIDKIKIFPPIGESAGELTLTGYLKTKDQDVVAIPEPRELIKNRKKGESKYKQYVIEAGVLEGELEDFSKKSVERSISINLRSQLSKTSGNFSTLMERQFAETLNLHMRFPELIMGEIYLLALVGYDYKKVAKREIDWNENFATKIIPLFRELNNRVTTGPEGFYKYERLCLLLVDFRKDPPEVISTAEELKQLGFITDTKKYCMDGLGIYDFFDDIIEIYKNRHGKTKIFK